MNRVIFILLDQACFLFHALLILFNMVGWAWRRTRLLHLITLGLVCFSWFGLGAFYGWGYCLCTDAHFRIRERLGYEDSESSYVQLLSAKWMGIELDLDTANWLSAAVLVGILLATTAAWVGARRKRNQAAR